MMPRAIDCVELLAIAQAAWRVNGNELIQASKDGRIPNVTLVKETAYNNVPTVEVTDEDRTQAAAMREYISQRVMLSKLTGRSLSEFINKINEIIVNDKVNPRNAGLIAWAPKVYSDLQKSDTAQQEFGLLALTSKYIGTVGSKVELEFHTVTKRWTNNYGCFRYSGHDGNGNLVGFLSKNDYPLVAKIRARVKAQETGRLSGGKTTYLNYTKPVN